ncbi:hypothetical protein [Pontibacter sp. G13]|uniref:hypothetical protein n=1 Tax=Pontibacter sp. G13 TaxID=3074898 RepID=UPI0028899960|nr:hypothetical protein [Pontibacter sp. G13]WNJ20541.1 hypothetical protein RJD25_08665 [Pontibacter sp. G13]
MKTMKNDFHLSDQEKRAQLERKYGNVFANAGNIIAIALLVLTGGLTLLYVKGNRIGFLLCLIVAIAIPYFWRTWKQDNKNSDIDTEFREWKKAQWKANNSLSYQNSTKIREVQSQMSEISQKATDLQTQISQTQNYLSKVRRILKDPDLLDSLKESTQERKEDLEDTLRVKQDLMAFYQDAISVLNRQIKNLQFQIELEKVDQFIEGTSQDHFGDTGEVEDAHISLTFLHEMRSLEHDIPDMNSQSISRESRRLLADRLAELRSEHFSE